MAKKVEAIKKLAVALNFGQLSDYTATNVVGVLKQLAVQAQCAASVDEIRTNSIAGIIDYIAENYGSEVKEPYDLGISETHATVTIKRNGKTIEAGNDILYNGDKLTITAAADEGYTLDTLTVNGEAFTSGNKFTVNGHNVAIVASASETPAAEDPTT